MARSKLIIATSFAVAFVLLAAGAALAEPLSKAEWREEATGICSDADAEASSIVNEEVGSNASPTPDQLQAVADRVVPVIEQAVDDVVALEEPSAFKKTVKKWAATVRALTGEVEDDPQVLLEGSQRVIQAGKLAKKIGLSGCT